MTTDPNTNPLPKDEWVAAFVDEMVRVTGDPKVEAYARGAAEASFQMTVDDVGEATDHTSAVEAVEIDMSYWDAD